MEKERSEVLEYWNKDNVESMYDKLLIGLEIDSIKKLMKPESFILDAGCGEGEGTVEYARIPGAKIIAADFSDTRLKKAEALLNGANNVELRKMDFLSEFDFDERFDFIVSQRFLINLINFDNQKKTIERFVSFLKPGGSIIILEGSIPGVNQLNKVREGYGMKGIDIPWHNVFFQDEELENFAGSIGLTLTKKSGLGGYYLLTRAARPCFDTQLNWDAKFNVQTAEMFKSGELNIEADYSRTRLWQFTKSK